MANYSRKIQTDNEALSSLTGADNWFHIDGSNTNPITLRSNGGRLLRVILNTNGNTLIIRNGSERIATIASDCPEQTFNYGIYCNGDIIVEAGGAISATVIVD